MKENVNEFNEEIIDSYEARFLDVGLGASSFFINEETKESFFIDFGPKTNGGNLIKELQENEPTKIGGIITHGHDDHYGNFAKVINYALREKIEISKFIIPGFEKKNLQFQKEVDKVYTAFISQEYKIKEKLPCDVSLYKTIMNNLCDGAKHRDVDEIINNIALNSEHSKKEISLIYNSFAKRIEEVGYKKFYAEEMLIRDDDMVKSIAVNNYRKFCKKYDNKALDYEELQNNCNEILLEKGYEQGIKDSKKVGQIFSKIVSIENNEERKFNFGEGLSTITYSQNPKEYSKFYRKRSSDKNEQDKEELASQNNQSLENLVSLGNKHVIWVRGDQGTEMDILLDKKLQNKERNNEKLSDFEKTLKKVNDILVAHHGSDYSFYVPLYENYLDLAELYIISTCEGPKNHSSQLTKEKIAKLGKDFLDTEFCGTISLKIECTQEHKYVYLNCDVMRGETRKLISSEKEIFREISDNVEELCKKAYKKNLENQDIMFEISNKIAHGEQVKQSLIRKVCDNELVRNINEYNDELLAIRTMRQIHNKGILISTDKNFEREILRTYYENGRVSNEYKENVKEEILKK